MGHLVDENIKKRDSTVNFFFNGKFQVGVFAIEVG
jgi:hypothetical protein